MAPVASILEGATARGVLWQAGRRRFLLEVPEVGRYLVCDGTCITIDPAPGASEEEMIRFLRKAPLAALIYERGGLAFHAAALSPPSPWPRGVDGGGRASAFLIAGDSGAGKSTLLAAMLQRGWSLFADDLAVVEEDENGRPVVVPTFSEVALWQDAVEKLGLSAAAREALSGPLGLSLLRFPLAPSPQFLSAVYWLCVHPKDEIEIDEVAGADRFRAIGRLTYNSHIADALLDRAVYWRFASAIAQGIPLFRIRRPLGRWSVEGLANRLSGGVSEIRRPAGD